jgi:hypothetical protein
VRTHVAQILAEQSASFGNLTLAIAKKEMNMDSIFKTSIVGETHVDCHLPFDYRRALSSFFMTGGELLVFPITISVGDVAVSVAAADICFAGMFLPVANNALRMSNLAAKATGLPLLKDVFETLTGSRKKAGATPIEVTFKAQAYESDFTSLKSIATAMNRVDVILVACKGQNYLATLHEHAKALAKKALCSMTLHLAQEQQDGIQHLGKLVDMITHEFSTLIVSEAPSEQKLLKLCDSKEAEQVYILFNRYVAMLQSNKGALAVAVELVEKGSPLENQQQLATTGKVQDAHDTMLEGRCDSLLGVGGTLANVTVCQALYRKLKPGENREDLASKCKSGLAKKPLCNATPVLCARLETLIRQ